MLRLNLLIVQSAGKFESPFPECKDDGIHCHEDKITNTTSENFV